MDWKALFGKAKTVTEREHAELVEGAAKNPKRFVNIVIGVVVALLIAVGIAYCSKARATGYEHEAVKHGWKWVKPVKPPVVVAPPAPAPVPPPAAAPVSTAAPAQPAQQPAAGGGKATSWFAKGGWAFIGVGAYFTAAIYSHFIWCAEDDKKPAKERRCYRPLRDGMP